MNEKKKQKVYAVNKLGNVLMRKSASMHSDESATLVLGKDHRM